MSRTMHASREYGNARSHVDTQRVSYAHAPSEDYNTPERRRPTHSGRHSYSAHNSSHAQRVNAHPVSYHTEGKSHAMLDETKRNGRRHEPATSQRDSHTVAARHTPRPVSSHHPRHRTRDDARRESPAAVQRGGRAASASDEGTFHRRPVLPVTASAGVSFDGRRTHGDAARPDSATVLVRAEPDRTTSTPRRRRRSDGPHRVHSRRSRHRTTTTAHHRDFSTTRDPVTLTTAARTETRRYISPVRSVPTTARDVVRGAYGHFNGTSPAMRDGGVGYTSAAPTSARHGRTHPVRPHTESSWGRSVAWDGTRSTSSEVLHSVDVARNGDEGRSRTTAASRGCADLSYVPPHSYLQDKITETRAWIARMTREMAAERAARSPRRRAAAPRGVAVVRLPEEADVPVAFSATSSSRSSSSRSEMGKWGRGTGVVAVPVAPRPHTSRRTTSRRTTRKAKESKTARVAREDAETTSPVAVPSFLSFLDGSRFATTEALCEHNVSIGTQLSDDHLELLREVVFHYDEVAFGELLYGDDIQAQLKDIETMMNDHVAGMVSGGKGDRGTAMQGKPYRDMQAAYTQALRDFNERAASAHKALLGAGQGLLEAIKTAAQKPSNEPYDAHAAPVQETSHQPY